jgi:hypothetical protein
VVVSRLVQEETKERTPEIIEEVRGGGNNFLT